MSYKIAFWILLSLNLAVVAFLFSIYKMLEVSV